MESPVSGSSLFSTSSDAATLVIAANWSWRSIAADCVDISLLTSTSWAISAMIVGSGGSAFKIDARSGSVSIAASRAVANDGSSSPSSASAWVMARWSACGLPLIPSAIAPATTTRRTNGASTSAMSGSWLAPTASTTLSGSRHASSRAAPIAAWSLPSAAVSASTRSSCEQRVLSGR